MMKQTIISSAELQLADVIRRVENDGVHSPFSDMTVKNIEKNGDDILITVFRPYVHTADFSMTSGVLCYVGIDIHTFWARKDDKYILLDRKNLK